MARSSDIPTFKLSSEESGLRMALQVALPTLLRIDAATFSTFASVRPATKTGRSLKT
jgi:hypothetical protein